MIHIRLLVFFAFLLLSDVVAAQPIGEEQATTFSGPQPGNPPAPVPLTGIEYLLVAGGVLGARRIYTKIKSR